MLQQLPVAASMESSATVEPAPPSRWSEAMKSTAATHRGAASESTVKSIPAATIEGWAATIEPRPPAVESATAVEAMEPWTRADEHAAGKIVRAIVAIRRAGIRGVPVIAISADRGRANVGWGYVPWPKSNANPNLRVSRARHYHAKPEQYSVL
jgi:hypothetical protein